VLLLHETPDGASHYDWLLSPIDAPTDPDARALVAFRVHERIDRARGRGAFPGQRIGDHRVVYLDFEGEISGGRGRVRRIARGLWLPERVEPDAIRGEIVWEGGDPVGIKGWRVSGDRWFFQAAPSR